MLNRTYRVVKIGKRKRILIDFEDKQYEIISIFLQSDVTAFKEYVIEAFNKIVSKESEHEEITGNVCSIEIEENTTKIYDALAEDGLGNWCEIDTLQLWEIINEYLEKIEKEIDMWYTLS